MSALKQLIADRYELTDLLGQGGMGAVYRGHDTQTGHTVAVKALRQDVGALDPLFFDRFRREAETLRRLDHPSIVKMLDAVQDGERQFLVMEYVPGGSLDRLLRRSSLSVRQVLEIGLDLADALSRVHRLGVVHRDIKPANVLLAADGTPRLTDFGAAYEGAGTRLTETGMMIGTFAYLSPEVCEGAPPDARADIWAFGVMLFEMLAGRRPFEGASPGALLTSIVTRPAPDVREFRPDTPAALADLLAAMLEKDRDRRIASARLVGATLESILRGALPETATPPRRRAARPGEPTSSGTVSAVDAPKLLAELLSPADTPATATVAAPRRAPSRAMGAMWLLWAAVGVMALALAALLLLPRDTPISTSSVPSSTLLPTAVPSVEPVAPGEHMVLVARLEPLGAPARDESRFIADALRQTLEQDAPFSRIKVRSLPAVIASAAEARAAAEASGATLVVWGNDQGDHQELNVQVGASPAFAGIALSRADVEQAANVRLKITDARSQSLAPYVLGALSMLQNADGDVFETVRTIAIMGLARGEPAEPLGSSVATHYHRATAAFATDPAAAAAELDQAIGLAGGNPILYTSRALAYQRLGRPDEARRDVETARRLGPEGWAVPRAMLAGQAAQRGDLAAAIAECDELVRLRPDDWFAVTYRGALRSLAGDRAGARADLERAIALGPKASYPYALATLLALREGRFADASSYTATIVRDFPDPTLGRRILEGALGASDQSNLLGALVSSVTSLAIGQYDQAEAEAAGIMAAQPGLADAAVVRGLAACSLGRPGDAAAIYEAGLQAAPEDPLLHLLRADARLRLGDPGGADADLAAAAVAPPFVPHAEAVRARALGCESLLAARQ